MIIRARLSRVRLDRGGYDASGRYWGSGTPLYRYELEHPQGGHSGHLRASDREEAKRWLGVKYPSYELHFYGDIAPRLAGGLPA